MTWTHFWDMNSGGGQKLEFKHIFIQAKEDEAKRIFFARFGRNPDCVSCTCCGPDYSISEGKSLAAITAFHRGCAYDKNGYVEKWSGESYRKYIPLKEYRKSKGVCVIPAKEIQKFERDLDVPSQGYVWVG